MAGKDRAGARTKGKGSRPKKATPKDFHQERLGRGNRTAKDARPVPSKEGEDEVKRGLGRKVRELRQERGLNVKQLADRARVTPGMISQLERGQVAPSVATLLRLAAELGVGIGDFFESEGPRGMVVRADERASQDWPLIGVRDELLSADSLGHLQVFWSRLAPGATSGPELLEHGSLAEFVLVISGSMEVLLGETRVSLDTGDAVTFSGAIPHGFENPNPDPADLVWVVTPASY